jgi:hypothetical protein
VIETKITKAQEQGDTPGRRASNSGRDNRGRRTSGRDSLFLSATVRRRCDSQDELIPVRIRNLSAVGVMAEYTDVVAPDEPVIVTVRGIGPVAGKVAWIKRGRIGIAFDAEVDPLLARKPVASQAPADPAQRKPL